MMFVGFVKRFKLLLNLICLLGVLSLVSCAKKVKNNEDCSFDELKANTASYIDKNRKDLAIDALEKMVENYSDKPEITDYRLKLANLYFEKGEYEPAYTWFKKFYKLNPSDLQADFANYRGILCKFHQTFGPNRDMTNVLKTVKKCEKYLTSSDKNSKFKKEVKDVLYTCEKMLIDHEVFVYDFYIRRGKLQSAQSRIDYLKENFVKKHKDLEPQILYLEIKLAHNQKNKELETQKLQALENKFGNSHYVAMAQNLGSKIRDNFLF